MTTPIMKPLKAFRVGEPLPKTEEKLRGEEFPHDGFSPMTSGAKWIDTEEKIQESRQKAFQNSAAPSPEEKNERFHELYGGSAKTVTAVRLPIPKPKTALPRSSYRTTHDHAARTTTLIQMIEDHEVKRFPAVPGILSLRKALVVNNIFSRKHPLFRNA